MNTLFSKHPALLAFAAFFAFSVAAAAPAQAQLQRIDQTVFGMDCAPCAYGLEKQIKGFGGVTGVDVSLNDGLAALTLASGNDLRLAALRTAISESGFSPRKAQVEVAGTLDRQNGQWMLTTPSGERFRLASAPDARDLAPGARVTATGTVPEGTRAPDQGWTLRVESVRDAA